jgi:predicted methyltransferase
MLIAPPASRRNRLLLSLLFALACSAPQAALTPASPAVEPRGEAGSVEAQESAAPAAPSDYAEILAAPDRDPDDRALDPQRHPAELLAFAGVKPGMRVAELAAAGGYTTELLARAVGPEGRVYGQNSKFILERFAEGPWSQRLKKPVLANVERLDRQFEAPFPQNVSDLDAVLIVLFYHDLVWFESDRASVNRAVFEALAPGGVYVVIDHSARPGDGVSQAQALHRIEESVVQSEIEAAGFVLDRSADFLRNPADSRDWNAAPSASGERRGQSDRFALRFVKPAAR